MNLRDSFVKTARTVLWASILFSVGCTAIESDRPISSVLTQEPTPVPQSTSYVVSKNEFLQKSPEELCNSLANIKILPYKDPNDTDPIYEALIAKGDDAILCLVARIPEVTPMKDPRTAPNVQDYVVGDTAIFVLVRIIKAEGPQRGELLQEMLPPRYREEWKTNGVYAYFNYVSEDKNRKELQRWWLQWLKQNKKEVFVKIGAQ